MSNNPILYNAALCGAIGGLSNERWPSSTNSADYISLRNTAVTFATAVDAAIPTDASYTQQHAELLNGMCTNVLSARGSAGASTAIANVLGSIFALMKTQLEAVGGGGGATLTNLSAVVYVDGGTAVAPADQNGNIETPFSTLADAVASFDTGGGTIYVVLGDYTAEPALNVNVQNLTIACLDNSNVCLLPAITIIASPGKNLYLQNCNSPIVLGDATSVLYLDNAFVTEASVGQIIAKNSTVEQLTAEGGDPSILSDGCSAITLICDDITMVDSGVSTVMLSSGTATLRNCRIVADCTLTTVNAKDCEGFGVNNAMTISDSGVFDSCTFTCPGITATGGANFRNCSTNGADACPLTADSIYFWNCDWSGNITGTSELQIDAESFQKLRNNGNTVTSGNTTFLNLPNPDEFGNWNTAAPFGARFLNAGHQPGLYLLSLTAFNRVSGVGTLENQLQWSQPFGVGPSTFDLPDADLADVGMIVNVSMSVWTDGTAPVEIFLVPVGMTVPGDIDIVNVATLLGAS